MRTINGHTAAGSMILAAVLAATGCNSKSASAGLDHKLQEMAITAERDSLLNEVAANGKLLGDIQAAIAAVQSTPAKGTAESPDLQVTLDQRGYVLDRVKQVTTRLKEARTQLANTERRVGRLTQKLDSIGGDFSAAKTNLADLTGIVETQRSTIEALTAQTDKLLGENQILSDSVYRLTDVQHTAFYVVGTRQQLIALGVLVEDGHRAIPLIGKRGVAPARALPLEAFTSIDRNAVREIPLPKSDKSYRIVSRQNVAYLASSKRGEVKGTLAIASPDHFWEASRYLIVVEQ